MDADSLLKATRVILILFKSLDYASKAPNVLDKRMAYLAQYQFF